MIGYGFLGGHKLEPLARIPLAHEATIIARCQSARSVHGRAAEAWSYEESAAWLRNAARVKRHGVTVPQPLCRPAQENTPTPVECAQAGSNSGADVSQAARMRILAHRPFSGQTLDRHEPRACASGYTAPTVRGLSGATPEHPTTLPSGVSCDREHEHTSGRQSQRNPFIGDEAPEVIERYAEIRGV